ncbi:hypothetical protein Bca101_019420 [Brassica carinata]
MKHHNLAAKRILKSTPPPSDLELSGTLQSRRLKEKRRPSQSSNPKNRLRLESVHCLAESPDEHQTTGSAASCRESTGSAVKDFRSLPNH